MLMPGHLLLYHPGVAKLKELVDSGELGDVLYVYGNRQNLGTDPAGRERALEPRRPRPFSDPPPRRRGAVEVWARGESFLKQGVEDVVFCYLRFPSGKIAHMHLSWLDPHKMRRMTVVGSQKMAVFDDMELDRKITVYDKAAEQPLRHVRRMADANRGHLQPADRERRAAPARMRALPRPRPRSTETSFARRVTGSPSCASSSSFRHRSTENRHSEMGVRQGRARRRPRRAP